MYSNIYYIDYINLHCFATDIRSIFYGIDEFIIITMVFEYYPSHFLCLLLKVLYNCK